MDPNTTTQDKVLAPHLVQLRTPPRAVDIPYGRVGVCVTDASMFKAECATCDVNPGPGPYIALGRTLRSRLSRGVVVQAIGIYSGVHYFTVRGTESPINDTDMIEAGHQSFNSFFLVAL